MVPSRAKRIDREQWSEHSSRLSQKNLVVSAEGFVDAEVAAATLRVVPDQLVSVPIFVRPVAPKSLPVGVGTGT